MPPCRAGGLQEPETSCPACSGFLVVLSGVPRSPHVPVKPAGGPPPSGTTDRKSWPGDLRQTLDVIRRMLAAPTGTRHSALGHVSDRALSRLASIIRAIRSPRDSSLRKRTFSRARRSTMPPVAPVSSWVTRMTKTIEAPTSHGRPPVGPTVRAGRAAAIGHTFTRHASAIRLRARHKTSRRACPSPKPRPATRASSSARRPGGTGNRTVRKPERIAPCRLRSRRETLTRRSERRATAYPPRGGLATQRRLSDGNHWGVGAPGGTRTPGIRLRRRRPWPVLAGT